MEQHVDDDLECDEDDDDLLGSSAAPLIAHLRGGGDGVRGPLKDAEGGEGGSREGASAQGGGREEGPVDGRPGFGGERTCGDGRGQMPGGVCWVWRGAGRKDVAGGGGCGEEGRGLPALSGTVNAHLKDKSAFLLVNVQLAVRFGGSDTS